MCVSERQDDSGLLLSCCYNFVADYQFRSSAFTVHFTAAQTQKVEVVVVVKRARVHLVGINNKKHLEAGLVS